MEEEIIQMDEEIYVLLVDSRLTDKLMGKVNDKFRGIFMTWEDAEEAAKEHGYGEGSFHVIPVSSFRWMDAMEERKIQF